MICMNQTANTIISILLLSLLFMSILTIGERSIYNYHSPYFSNNLDQLSMAKRQKRIRQQQYRLELIGQMNQKYERAKKRKQQEITYNRKYERAYTQQPYNDYQRKISIFDREGQFNNNVSNSLQKIRRKQPKIQQYIPSSFSYVEKASRQFKDNFYNDYSGNKIDQRIQTLEVGSSDKFGNIMVDLQKRRKELNTYEDNKIEEVYERMYDSVQKLHNENYTNIPTQPSGKPLFQSSQDRRYDRYHKNTAKLTINPEQEQPLYFNKLPPLFKNHHLQRQRSNDDSQRNWKEWYAKQKLRQLQSYYKKIVSNGQASRVQSLSRMNGQSRNYNN